MAAPWGPSPILFLPLGSSSDLRGPSLKPPISKPPVSAPPSCNLISFSDCCAFHNRYPPTAATSSSTPAAAPPTVAMMSSAPPSVALPLVPPSRASSVVTNPKPNPLPNHLRCSRKASGWQCPLPILISGGGVCTKHVTKMLFQVITDKARGKLKEGKAQGMVEKKCKLVDGCYVAPTVDENGIPPQHAAIVTNLSCVNTVSASTQGARQSASPNEDISVHPKIMQYASANEGNSISYNEVLKQQHTICPRLAPVDIVMSPKLKSFKEGIPAYLLTPLELEESIKVCKWHVMVKFPQFYPPLNR